MLFTPEQLNDVMEGLSRKEEEFILWTHGMAKRQLYEISNAEFSAYAGASSSLIAESLLNKAVFRGTMKSFGFTRMGEKVADKILRRDEAAKDLLKLVEKPLELQT